MGSSSPLAKSRVTSDFGKARERKFDHLVLQGFCYLAFEQCRTSTECAIPTAGCKKAGISQGKLQSLLFRFEQDQTWEWDTRTTTAQITYYKSLKNYANWIDYGKYILSKFYPQLYSYFNVTKV